jgi:hypothetical protein
MHASLSQMFGLLGLPCEEKKKDEPKRRDQIKQEDRVPVPLADRTGDNKHDDRRD